ncbi:DsbA family protein [Allorhizobium borbori]|uniref:Protein-disulfide isomerase n=1 Tax=Allorhizobium borbori TaxID=485907 RepID=A0A7W6P100_9HYPH|nr:DsbA family protein [Allorhizobium borbori]MBB4103073.1 protein-disulfide isomerase [Allorhizobium borbori]
MQRRQIVMGAATGIGALWILGGPAKAAEIPPALTNPGPLTEQVFGAADAPVTVVEYASMTCGHCANFHLNVWPDVKKEFVDTGKVRFIIREFPFDPRATAAFMLARCMGDDKWYATVDLLFRSQSVWARAADGTQGFLSALSLTGLDKATMETCLSDQALLDKINKVAATGRELGVSSTPTFFVNGVKYEGVIPLEKFRSILAPLLAEAGK